jgi:toxin YoeB
MDDTIFTRDALRQYFAWQTDNSKISRKINTLIEDIYRNGFLKGIGKPEPLKHQKGCSRHIDEENRLIYTGDEHQNLVIISCKGHYED